MSKFASSHVEDETSEVGIHMECFVAVVGLWCLRQVHFILES